MKLSDAARAEAWQLENDDLPDVRKTTITQPNLGKSAVVHVRLSAAAALNVPVSDVIRAAISRHLHERGESVEVGYLVRALHALGVRLVVGEESYVQQP
jgi:hypothetical protein